MAAYQKPIKQDIALISQSGTVRIVALVPRNNRVFFCDRTHPLFPYSDNKHPGVKWFAEV